MRFALTFIFVASAGFISLPGDQLRAPISPRARAVIATSRAGLLQFGSLAPVLSDIGRRLRTTLGLMSMRGIRVTDS
jgi:hypothetical protein